MVFSSFLWDMQRWGRFFPGKVLERGLSTETIQEWSADFGAILALIKVHQWAFMICCIGEALVSLSMTYFGAVTSEEEASQRPVHAGLHIQ